MAKKQDSKILIGQILLVLGIALAVIGVLITSFFSSLFTAGMMAGLNATELPPGMTTTNFNGLFSGMMLALAVVSVAGIVASILSLWFSFKNDQSKAGVLAIAASVLPPLGILQLVAGILFLVSRD